MTILEFLEKISHNSHENSRMIPPTEFHAKSMRVWRLCIHAGHLKIRTASQAVLYVNQHICIDVTNYQDTVCQSTYMVCTSISIVYMTIDILCVDPVTSMHVHVYELTYSILIGCGAQLVSFTNGLIKYRDTFHKSLYVHTVTIKS